MNLIFQKLFMILLKFINIAGCMYYELIYIDYFLKKERQTNLLLKHGCNFEPCRPENIIVMRKK